jgi:precorrin isomerase
MPRTGIMKTRLEQLHSVVIEHVEERLFAKARKEQDETKMSQEIRNRTEHGNAEFETISAC